MKKEYWRVKVYNRDYDYAIYPLDEMDKALECIELQMESLEEELDITIEIIKMTDEEYQEILEDK